MNNNKIWSLIDHRQDDVVIVSTIKSGTTWVQQIVSQLIFKGEKNPNLSDTSLWIDNLREHDQNTILNTIEHQTHRRFFKTHSPANIVLNPISKKVKYIFITRDFRDVVWSFFNHFTKSKYPLGDPKKKQVEKQLRESISPHEFWKIIIENKYKFSKCNEYNIIWSYFNTVNSWFNAAKNNNNILLIHFNDLKHDLLGNVKKISKFLDFDYSSDTFHLIKSRCTFEYMKQNGRKCVPKHFHNISTTFINKGINKRWFDCFTEEDYSEYNNLLDMFFKNDVKEWSQSGKLLKI